ncbi:alpha/beta fold hydrolase [Paenibacillus illinoisensis]|uniref:Pimeloyl-CoA synthesis protein n=1 Tax=Paenibacillus illinoisensis TaxID=59845 RepID=A0A2W0CCA3_9BACL|nr:alpha/beta hydrolase [Paenibacillus illinoisensis]PYY29807.1 Pimeloyl-CoA synthesis protein [Paenibacillus illinoisensis]
MFIHGNFNDHWIWEEQLDALAHCNYVVAYDLRGYGRSHTPRNPFSNVDDLKVLLDSLELSKVNLVGSSMGGSVAIDFTLAYPDRVHRVILAAPSISGRNYPASMLWQGIKQHLQVKLNGCEKAVEAFITNPYWRYFFPDVKKEKAWLKTVGNVRNPGNFCRFPPGFSRVFKPYAINRLEEIHKPVLIFIGECDHSYNRETAEILHTGIKNSTKIVMQDCGHLPFIEEPETFSSHVKEFLR